MASLASSARALAFLGFFLLVDMLIASSAWWGHRFHSRMAESMATRSW
jgi:hypothetical protein